MSLSRVSGCNAFFVSARLEKKRRNNPPFLAIVSQAVEEVRWLCTDDIRRSSCGTFPVLLSDILLVYEILSWDVISVQGKEKSPTWDAFLPLFFILGHRLKKNLGAWVWVWSVITPHNPKSFVEKPTGLEEAEEEWMNPSSVLRIHLQSCASAVPLSGFWFHLETSPNLP